MIYHPATPHGNAVHSAEARIGRYYIRRDDYDTFSTYALSIGEPRHMDWPNRTPLGAYGMIHASTRTNGGFRVSAVAAKSRDTVPLPEEYTPTTDIIEYMISLAPLVAAATASGEDPFMHNAWETAKKGY